MKKTLKCIRCGCQKLYSVRREKKRCIRMEAWQITPAFNPKRMVQYFALVFKGFTSGCNCTGNSNSQTKGVPPRSGCNPNNCPNHLLFTGHYSSFVVIKRIVLLSRWSCVRIAPGSLDDNPYFPTREWGVFVGFHCGPILTENDRNTPF
jgi:hypothetical protein